MEQPLNINSIFVTFAVLKLERSSEVRPQDLNILYISVTFAVLNLVTSREVREEQLENIVLIFVTFSVLK